MSRLAGKRALITGATALGGSINNTFNNLAGTLNDHQPS